jgi:hypothetical protein
MPKKMLTANEIGLLWTQYIQNSMAIPLLEYFKLINEEKAMEPIIALSRDIAESGVQQCEMFFEEAGLPVPYGYSLDDMNPNAQKLFTEAFMLAFMGHIGKVGLTSDGLSLGASAREDVRHFFTERISKQDQLYNLCVNTSEELGLFTRSPQIEVENRREFIEGKGYYHPFSKRSLNTIEIMHLYENASNNILGEAICQAFAQTSKNKTVKNFMVKGKEMSIKHRKIFMNILDHSGIMTPSHSSNYVTNHTDPVFSYRLMMYMMSVFTTAGHANYANGATHTLRYDIVFTYHRLSVDTAIYSKDGLDIMIRNGWFEEPPQAPDKQKLIQ